MPNAAIRPFKLELQDLRTTLEIRTRINDCSKTGKRPGPFIFRQMRRVLDSGFLPVIWTTPKHLRSQQMLRFEILPGPPQSRGVLCGVDIASLLRMTILPARNRSNASNPVQFAFSIRPVGCEPSGMNLTLILYGGNK
jgi:hypothetical protein